MSKRETEEQTLQERNPFEIAADDAMLYGAGWVRISRMGGGKFMWEHIPNEEVCSAQRESLVQH